MSDRNSEPERSPDAKGEKRDGRETAEAALRTLREVSLGNLSLAQAARDLGLPDGGHVLRWLREAGMPMAKLPAETARAQADAARDALEECRIEKRAQKKR